MLGKLDLNQIETWDSEKIFFICHTSNFKMNTDSKFLSKMSFYVSDQSEIIRFFFCYLHSMEKKLLGWDFGCLRPGFIAGASKASRKRLRKGSSLRLFGPSCGTLRPSARRPDSRRRNRTVASSDPGARLSEPLEARCGIRARDGCPETFARVSSQCSSKDSTDVSFRLTFFLLHSRSYSKLTPMCL